MYSSDSLTKEPNGHVSLTWVDVFFYKYVSVGNWKHSPVDVYTYSSLTDHICLYYFCRRSPKTISAQTTLNSNQQFDWFELYDDLQESSRTKNGRRQRSGVHTRCFTALPSLMLRLWISRIGYCQFWLQGALLICCWRLGVFGFSVAFVLLWIVSINIWVLSEPSTQVFNHFRGDFFSSFLSRNKAPWSHTIQIRSS